MTRHRDQPLDARCARCGKTHTLYCTDDPPHVRGEFFACTCLATGQVVRMW